MDMSAIAISENRGHEFVGEWGEVYGRVWRGGRGGRNIIKLQKQTTKK